MSKSARSNGVDRKKKIVCVIYAPKRKKRQRLKICHACALLQYRKGIYARSLMNFIWFSFAFLLFFAQKSNRRYVFSVCFTFFLLYLRFFVVFSISTPNHLLETAAVNLLQSFRFIRVYGYENIWLVAVNLAMQAHLFWSFFPYIVSLSFHYVTTIIRCCSFPFVDHRKRSTYWPLPSYEKCLSLVHIAFLLLLQF